MMRAFLSVILLACCADAVSADETPQITWPTTPHVIDFGPTPQPVVPSGPQPVSSLKADELLVVESNVQVFIRRFPDGIIEVESASGPIRARAKFAGGTGKVETREFRGAYVYFLTAGKSGKVILDLIPVGVSEESSIARRELSVTDGTTPNPPPDPWPEPEPDPEPDTKPQPEPKPEPVKSFRVIFVKESGVTLPSAQNAIPGAKSLRNYLHTKTTPESVIAGWREYDPQQTTENELPGMAALWQAVKPQLLPAPCMVIEVNGKATVMPFPANATECLATLKKYGGE
jgi:hypothetical protein